MDHEEDDPARPGTSALREREPDRMSHVRRGRAIMAALPRKRSSLRTSVTTARSEMPTELEKDATTSRRAVRSLRLRFPVDTRRQDRPPDLAGGRLRG